MSAEPFTELKSRLATIADLRKAASLLFWDQQVMMPRAGAEGRAGDRQRGRPAEDLLDARAGAAHRRKARGTRGEIPHVTS
jgi:hypothetical protein